MGGRQVASLLAAISEDIQRHIKRDRTEWQSADGLRAETLTGATIDEKPSGAGALVAVSPRLVHRSHCQCRQDDVEPRPLAGRTLDLDSPAMVLDDAVHDGEAEPGALADLSRGEKRLEHPSLRRRVHPAPRVRNGEAQMSAIK